MSKSVRGRRWLIRSGPAAATFPNGEYPPLIRCLLALRGVPAGGERTFFFGSASTAEPLALPGIERAVARILGAIEAGERIAVYGDYDVDGVTAAAILSEGIRDLGGDVIAHIPNRFTDGYGLTREGLSEVRGRGASLVISVDCGINANPEVEYAAEIGLHVVVLDHHVPPPILPDADAIVDPKLGEGPPDFDHLASCGLAFAVLRALYQTMAASLDEQRYLELVALGTVADMVPLTGENRRYVCEGLRALKDSRRPGIQALLEVASVNGTLTAETIAFRLAPRLNAAGRLEHAHLALELLTTADGERAHALACHLNDLNGRRQRLTGEAMAIARRLAADECAGASLIMVGGEQIGQGIVGLVAGKLAEEMYRPSIVYQRGDVYSHGSVRGIPEIDVVQCLSQGGHLLERWGGHSQAGGFTVRNERLPSLKAVLSEWAADRLAGADLRPVLEADVELPLAELRGPELRWLQYFEPCGQENPTPVFVSRRVPVMSTRMMGADNSHLRLKLRDGVTTWDAVAFSLAHAAPRPGTRIDVMYTVVPDRRGGRMELQLRDFALSD